MKRFTDTGKWGKQWFQDLPPRLKCFWQFICDNADAAGVWEPNYKLASFQIGETVCQDDLEQFGDRIAQTASGKVALTSFIEFQYGRLSEDCKAHAPIFRLLDKHLIRLSPDRVSIDYSMAINSHKEKETETDKEKEEGVQGERKTKARGTLAEVIAFCGELGLPASDAESCFHKWEGNGWRNGSSAIKDWRATIRSWKSSGYMPSQRQLQGGRAFPQTAAERHAQRAKRECPEVLEPTGTRARGAHIVDLSTVPELTDFDHAS